MTRDGTTPLLSVVVPVLDEVDCVAELARRVTAAAAGCELRLELLFVDDGSTDGTAARLQELHREHPHVKHIRFPRPFGHQAALAAGLDHAGGDVVVTMDGDLQHPPELIPELVAAWRAGAKVVNTVRRSELESPFKQLSSRWFYRAMELLTDVPVVPAGADFRLLDAEVVEHLTLLEERRLFMRGVVPWLGYPATRVPFDAGDRFAGRSKFGTLRMLRLALNGLFSFSIVPLRVITLLGAAITLLGLAYGVFVLWAWWSGAMPLAPGWMSLLGVMVMFGGVQLLSVGVASEYIGRIYEEVKRRPRYVIESTLGIDDR